MASGKASGHERSADGKARFSKTPLNRISTGLDKMSGLERIPEYRGFFYLPIHRW